MQGNFNIQRELAPSLTAVVGYVGSRGVHQAFRVDDANIVMPTLTPQGYLWPSPVGSGTPINPNVGAIRLLDWGGSSAYDALQVGLVKKMSHGFQLQGSFTWGKSIDDNSGTIAGDTLANSISSLSWFDLKLDRGVSDYNIPRVLVINGTWNIPGVASANGLLALAANGWELGSILKVQDGTPFTATFGTDGDPLGLNSSDPYDYPNRVVGPGCQTLTNPGNVLDYIKTQCFAVPNPVNLRGNSGRNILYGPGLVNLDSSLFKNFPIHKISESFVAQFRVEVFNIINHANFQAPNLVNSDIFNSDGTANTTAGALTATTTQARQLQFALKLTW